MHRRWALAPALALTLALTACGGRAPTTTGASGSPSTTAATDGVTTSGEPTPSEASPSGGASPAPATSRAPAKPTPSVRTIVFTVTGKRVSPAPGRTRLRVGERVQLVVVADRSDEVHIHTDPAIEARTTAGKPLVIPFTAPRAGVYEIELHDPELLVTRLVVN